MTQTPPSKSASENWAQTQEAGSLLGIRFLFGVYRLFGRPVFAVCVFPVIVYFFLVRKAARRASLDYLRRVRRHGGALPAGKSLLGLSLRHFLAFGSGMLDKLAAWAGDIDIARVRYSGRDEFLNQVDSGKGVLVIVSHLGNLELSRVVAEGRRRIQLNVLVHTQHAEKFNRMLRQIDPDSGLNLIQVTELTPATAIMLQNKLAAGEVVAVAGDRTPVGGGERTSTVQFLGAEASFPQGPYILAAILKCPVYLMFCVKHRRHHKIMFEPFASQIKLPRAERDSAIRAWAQRFAARLEYHVLQFPLQWFNYYDFWSSPQDSEVVE